MAQGVPVLADLLVGGAGTQGCWPGRPKGPGVSAGPLVGRARFWYEWLRAQGPRAGVVLLLYWAGFWGRWLRSPGLLEAGTSQLLGDPGPRLSGSGVEVVLRLIPTHWGVRQCLRAIAEPLVGGASSRAFWQRTWGSQNWCQPTGGWSCVLGPLLQGPGSPGVGVSHWWTSCGAPGVPELIPAHWWVLDPLVGGARSLGSPLIDMGIPGLVPAD